MPGCRGGFPVAAASFTTVVTRINAALAAFNGDDVGALAYAEASLRGGNLQGLTDSYGYNSGYLDQILTGAKPANVTAPAGYFTYNPAELFDGTYSVAEIRPTRQLAPPCGRSGKPARQPLRRDCRRQWWRRCPPGDPVDLGRRG